MNFLLLTWAVLLVFLFTGASDDTNSFSETHNLTNSTNLAKPGCNSTCGDVIVPYPFGIIMGLNCSIDKGFDIYCNMSSNPPRAYFSKTGVVSFKRISDSTVQTSSYVIRKCYYPNRTTLSQYPGGNYEATPYTISQLNKLIVIGCDVYARLTTVSKRVPYTSSGGGCMAFCPNPGEVVDDDCSGNGCCQSSITKDIINNYRINLYTMLDSNNTSDKRSLNPCTYAFICDLNGFKFNSSAYLNDANFKKRIEDTVPRVFEWAIGNLSCAEAEATHDFAWKQNPCSSSESLFRQQITRVDVDSREGGLQADFSPQIDVRRQRMLVFKQ